AVGREAEIDAGIAVEVERAINALGGALDRVDELRRQVLGRADNDVVALLVLEIVLDLFGSDEPRALRHAAELELPDREDAKTLIAKHANVELAARDILLGDGRSADAVVNEAHALDKLVVAVDDGRLRDAPGGVLIEAFDDEREGEARRAANLAPQREYGKGRQRNAGIDQKLLRQVLAASTQQTPGIADGIGASPPH